MGKGYKGRSCIYCLHHEAVGDGDHIIARKFFPLNKRANLPKAPTCKACNNEKSILEHYLTAVLPFGAKHADAGEVIKMTDRRLMNNKNLHLSLAEGFSPILISRNGEPWKPEWHLPLNGNKVEKLFEFVVRGIAWHHWKITFGDDHFVRASFLTAKGQQFFDLLFEGSTQRRVKGNFGEGAFIYDGVQSKETSELTLWLMSLYGLEVSGDPHSRFERCSTIYGLTFPKRSSVAEKLLKILNP